MDMKQMAPMPLCMDDAGCRPMPLPPINGGNGNGGSQRPNASIDPALLALAMGFVPFQAWETPYETDVALQRGTIFPSLDKPFIGEEAVRRV